MKPALLCPSRKEFARERVLAAWEDTGGEVLRLQSAWSTTISHSFHEVSCYGGVPFCATVARRFHLCLVEPARDLLCQIEDSWVGRRVEITSVGSLRHYRYPLFVKSLDYALFPSLVYASADSFRRQCGTLDPEVSVLVSSVVEFLMEVRTLVCNGAVVSSSPYSRSSMSFPKSALAFASRAAKDLPLPETCVVDIGLLSHDHWVVVEANPVWAANPLGTDLKVFCECLARSSYCVDRGVNSYGRAAQL
jgi:hypothetical protein